MLIMGFPGVSGRRIRNIGRPALCRHALNEAFFSGYDGFGFRGREMKQRGKTAGKTSVRCPFCNEDVQADASICRHCGNDLRIPESLTLENAELKERVANLRRELSDLHGRLGRQNKS